MRTGYDFDGYNPPLGQLLANVAEQLGDFDPGCRPGASDGHGMIIPRWPDGSSSTQDWVAPTGGGHLDGYNTAGKIKRPAKPEHDLPPGWVGGLMLAATTYLEPVSHGGGALCYWPRSHLAV